MAGWWLLAESGELWTHAQAAFARLRALVAQEGLVVVTDRAGLARACERLPGEGAQQHGKIGD